MKKLFFLISLFLISSCMNFYNGEILQNTNINLQQANFQFVGYATGSSSATYFLFWGGKYSKALVKDAMIDMKKKYPLKSYQAYSNITVDYRYHLFFPLGLIAREIKCTISAEIIEFTN